MVWRTLMTPDDQMEFDIQVDTHIPVSEDNILRALTVFMIPPVYEVAYEWMVSFLEPLDEEKPMIEKCVRDWCEKVV
jgi:hypothetical protein